MADLISDLVTAVWPTTDAKLTADTTTGYTTVKASAIRRAKLALYGTATIPSDDEDIPEIARIWIADRACLHLIPVAIDFYMQQKLSDTKENASIGYYDKVRALQDLRAELEQACQEGLAAAQNAVDLDHAPESIESTPAVSTAGLLVDPTVRAWLRGPY